MIKRKERKKERKRKLWVAILPAGKVNFKTKFIAKDKEGDYMEMKKSVQRKDTMLVNMYTPNMEKPNYINYIKQISTDIVGEIDVCLPQEKRKISYKPCNLHPN